LSRTSIAKLTARLKAQSALKKLSYREVQDLALKARNTLVGTKTACSKSKAIVFFYLLNALLLGLQFIFGVANNLTSDVPLRIPVWLPGVLAVKLTTFLALITSLGLVNLKLKEMQVRRAK